jgi:lipopolysaccharide export system protein LptA
MITDSFLPAQPKRILAAGLACAALLTFGSALLAQSGAAPAPKRRVVTYEADSYHNRPLASGETFSTLTGSVVIRSEESTLQTEKATYDGDTQVATSPTRLRLDDKQNTVVGDKGVAYYATRDVEITGNITINARPNPSDSANAAKGSARRNFKDPVTITCTKVRYNWQSKKAVLTGNLTIKQKDRTITGDRGLYDGTAETVTLVGNIKSRRPTGETGDAPGANSRAIACFKEGAEYFEVNKDPGLKNSKVSAKIPVREKPNGEVEVIESADTPRFSPAPDASPVPEPSETPTPAPPAGTPPR